MLQSDAITTLLPFLYGAAGGAVATFVGLRTRLAIMQRDIDDVKRQSEEAQRQLDEKLERMERKQLLTLEIMSGVARKVGADHRFTDQVVQFLAEAKDT